MSGRSRRPRAAALEPLRVEPRSEHPAAPAAPDAGAVPTATRPGLPWTDPWLRLAMVLPGLVALLLYLRTAAPTITWRNGGDDSGDLVVAAATLGIPHPTGYPTYVLLGHLFTWLPIGEVASRLSLLSALSAALAVALVGALIYLLARETLVAPPALAVAAAASGALVLATSRLFWSQAVIQEVYALHVAFATAVLFALLVWRLWGGERWLVGAAALVGLGMGNHVTLGLLLPAGTLMVALAKPGLWRDRRLLGRLAYAFGGGLCVYLYLMWRGAQFPALMWGEPYHPAGLLAHVTGALYHRYLFIGTPADALSRAAHVATLLVEQVGWPGFLLGVVGAWWLWQVQRPLALVGLVLGAGSVFFAVNYYARDSEVYLLPLFALWAVALGVGALALARLAGEVGGLTVRTIVRVALALVVVVGATAVVQGARGFTQVDASADTQARDFARDMLEAVPPRALLLTESDAHSFSLGYVQDVLGLRGDVAVVDVRLVEWAWYREALDRRHPGLALRGTTTAAIVVDLLQESARTGRPLYATDRLPVVARFLGATGPPFPVRMP